MPDTLTSTAVASIAGVAEVELRTVRQQRWRVSQVSTEMTSAVGTTKCGLYLNDYLVTPILGTGSAAGGEPPVDIGPSDVLKVRWTGAPSGATGKVIWFYEVIPYA